MREFDAACAAWQIVLADDTPWGAIDDDALLEALEARDRQFDLAAQATALLDIPALPHDAREKLTTMLARVASATLSLEQRVLGRRAAIGAALDATPEASAAAAWSPYARPLVPPRVDTRR